MGNNIILLLKIFHKETDKNSTQKCVRPDQEIHCTHTEVYLAYLFVFLFFFVEITVGRTIMKL